MSGSVGYKRKSATAPETATPKRAKSEASAPVEAPVVEIEHRTEIEKIQARNAFWTTLWHVDIFKDHKDIKESVVNKFYQRTANMKRQLKRSGMKGLKRNQKLS